MARKRKCATCGDYFEANGHPAELEFCSEECLSEHEDGQNPENLGPTGHGDICFSDADPGL